MGQTAARRRAPEILICQRPAPPHRFRFLGGAGGAGRATPITFATAWPGVADVAIVLSETDGFAAIRGAEAGIEVGELKAICCATKIRLKTSMVIAKAAIARWNTGIVVFILKSSREEENRKQAESAKRTAHSLS